MKKVIFSFFLLACSGSKANATVSFVRAASNCGTTSPLAATLTITASDTSVVIVAENPSTVAVSTITGGGTYTQRATATQGNTKVEVWSTAAGAATSSASVSVAFTGTATVVSLVVGDYAGIAALANVNNANNTNANPTIQVSVNGSNGWAIAGFATPTPTVTSGTGNLRAVDTNGCGTIVAALNDNTTTTPGIVTNTVTHTAGNWAAGVFEAPASLWKTQVGGFLVGP